MRKFAGLTLTELVLALAITSVVGLTTAGAASFLSAGHAETEAQYESLETARSALRQVQRSLRGARLLTCSSDGGVLVYWGGDSNEDGEIDLTEMRVIAYDSSEREVREHWVSFPDSWPSWFRDMMDTPMTLMDTLDLSTIESMLLVNSSCVSRVIATNVTGFAIVPVGMAPLASEAAVSIKVGQSPQDVTLRSAVTLRASGTAYVRDLGGGYYVYDGPNL